MSSNTGKDSSNTNWNKNQNPNDVKLQQGERQAGSDAFGQQQGSRGIKQDDNKNLGDRGSSGKDYKQTESGGARNLSGDSKRN